MHMMIHFLIPNLVEATQTHTGRETGMVTEI